MKRGTYKEINYKGMKIYAYSRDGKNFYYGTSKRISYLKFKKFA